MASKGAYTSEIKASVPVSPKILRAIIIIAGIAAIAVILWMFGEKEQKTPAAINAKPAPVSTSSAYPVCPGPEVYRFPDGARQITVTARTDCWSGWIVTPPGSSYRVSRGGAMSYLFWDNTVAVSESDMAEEWFGIMRGVFRVRSEEAVSHVTTITLGR